MKVALIGPQGVGKTTLLNNLPEEYQQHKIPELIRSTIAQHHDVKYNEDGDEASQELFFETYQREVEHRSDYISDRSLIDVVAYTKWLANNKKLDRDVYYNQLKKLVEFCRQNPDIIYFYVPIMFDVVDDGFRSTNEQYRQDIQDCITTIIIDVQDELGYDLHIFICGSSDQAERDNQLLDIIRNYDSYIK